MRIFGPLLTFDVIRLARKGRSFWLRCLYALALLGLLYLVYSEFFGRRGGRADVHDLPHFAEQFCTWFLVVQYVLVLVLTPALTCEAILEERQRRTLDCLLTTLLADHEIVLGKLAARLADVLLLLLTGLPILSLVQLFGGVDPTVIWGGFALNLVTMWMAGVVGIVCSISAHRMSMPLVETYFLVAIFNCAGGGCGLMGLVQADAPPFAVGIGVTVLFAIPFTVSAVSNIRSPAQRSVHQLIAAQSGQAPSFLLPVALPVEDAPQRERPAPRSLPSTPSLELLDDDPVLWKERYGGGPVSMAGCTLTLMVMFLCMGLMGIVHRKSGEFVVTESFITTALTTIALLMIARRAAGSIAAEKEQRTLESILATPLTLAEILSGKWWGTIYRAKPSFIQIGVLWAVAVGMSTFSILALPWLIAEVIVYTVLMASLGLVIGLWAETKREAQFSALMLGAFVLGGAPWWCTGGLIGWLTGTGSEAVVNIGVALTPVAVLYGTPLATDQHWLALSDRSYWSLTAIGFDLLMVFIVAELCWQYALVRFCRTCGRTDDLAPAERRP